MDEKKSHVDITRVVQDALNKQGLELKRKEPASPVEQALEAQGLEITSKEPPVAELPAGKVLVPISALDRLVDASARMKSKPEIAELVKSNPAIFEDLGHAIGNVAAGAIEKRASEPEAEEPSNEQGAIVLLLAGLAVGGLLLLQSKKAQQEAAARQAQAAAVAAMEAQQQEGK